MRAPALLPLLALAAAAVAYAQPSESERAAEAARAAQAAQGDAANVPEPADSEEELVPPDEQSVPWDRFLPGGQVMEAIRAGGLEDLDRSIAAAVEAKVDFNKPGAWGKDFLPLHFACFVANQGAVKKLMDAGADPNAKDGKGQNAIIAVLMAPPVIDFDGLGMLPIGNQDRILRYMLQNGGDVHSRTNLDNPAIHLAAFWGRSRALSLLLEFGVKHELDKDGCSPIHELVRSRFLNGKPYHETRDFNFDQLLDVLLMMGSDINRPCNDGKAALDLAADAMNRRAFEKFLDKGAKVNPGQEHTQKMYEKLMEIRERENREQEL